MIRVVPILFIALALTACQRSMQTSGGVQAQPGCGSAMIIPENAYNRARSAPFGPACGDNEVRVRVNGCSLRGFHNSFTVPAGRHELQVAYIDRAQRLNGRVLVSKAVALPLDAQAGRTYAIRGRTTWTGNGTPTVSVWAVDGTTRKTVSSVVVPQANVQITGDEHWFSWDADE